MLIDDIIVTGDDFEEMEKHIKHLIKKFEIKELGALNTSRPNP